MVSVLASLSKDNYQCDASVGCAYIMVETVQITASTDSPDIPTSLPLSIVPSDVLGSLVSSSIPATLITDTGSIDAPASTQWYSPFTSSVLTSSESASAISVIQTHQSNEDQSTLPVTTKTRTSSLQPSPTATRVSLLSNASKSVSASASAGSSEQSAASTKRNELGRLNVLSVGFDDSTAHMNAKGSVQITYEDNRSGSCAWDLLSWPLDCTKSGAGNWKPSACTNAMMYVE